MDRKGYKEIREVKVPKVTLALKAFKASRVLREFKDSLGHRDQLAWMAQTAHRVPRASKATLAR